MFEQHPLVKCYGFVGVQEIGENTIQLRLSCSSFIDIVINTTLNVICYTICQKYPLV